MARKRVVLLSRLRRLLRDERGNVALLFGLMLVPLVFATGVAVDYGRAVMIRSMLQSSVDAAALAGASAYIAPSAASTATALVQDFVTKGTAALPAGVTVSSTTITPGTTGSGNNVGYTMAVSVTIAVPTTILSIFTPSFAVTAAATAQNPVVTASFNTGGFVSYACDENQLYWYVVPANGGVPAASAMNLLWSNNNSNPPSVVSFQVAASAKIGFALENTTGARSSSLGGCNYGNNMYGSHPGDTQWLYSSLQAPSASWDIAPGGANTGTHGVYETSQDCALVVEKGTYNASAGTWSYPAAPQGQCSTTSGSGENMNTYNRYGQVTGVCNACGSGPTMATEMTNAAPSCAALGGASYQYDWNDMGATVDSYNYGNDMQYAFSCSGGSGADNGTSTNSVTLTN
jgi:Flp pilus assembly protein TadG